MAIKKKSFENLWQEIHDQLQISMKKEILTMRELLANMHQEEISLLGNDIKSLEQILHERSELIQRLGNLRSIRITVTNKLSKLASTEDTIATFDEIFSSSETLDCEMLLLRDQILALTDKMNSQLKQNQNLSTRVQNHSMHEPTRLPEMTAKPRKNAIITYPENISEVDPRS